MAVEAAVTAGNLTYLTSTRTVTLKVDHQPSLQIFTAAERCTLDQPGEWCMSSSSVSFYAPPCLGARRPPSKHKEQHGSKCSIVPTLLVERRTCHCHMVVQSARLTCYQSISVAADDRSDMLCSLLCRSCIDVRCPCQQHRQCWPGQLQPAG